MRLRGPAPLPPSAPARLQPRPTPDPLPPSPVPKRRCCFCCCCRCCRCTHGGTRAAGESASSGAGLTGTWHRWSGPPFWSSWPFCLGDAAGPGTRAALPLHGVLPGSRRPPSPPRGSVQPPLGCSPCPGGEALPQTAGGCLGPSLRLLAWLALGYVEPRGRRDPPSRPSSAGGCMLGPSFCPARPSGRGLVSSARAPAAPGAAESILGRDPNTALRRSGFLSPTLSTRKLRHSVEESPVLKVKRRG